MLNLHTHKGERTIVIGRVFNTLMLVFNCADTLHTLFQKQPCGICISTTHLLLMALSEVNTFGIQSQVLKLKRLHFLLVVWAILQHHLSPHWSLWHTEPVWQALQIILFLPPETMNIPPMLPTPSKCTTIQREKVKSVTSSSASPPGPQDVSTTLLSPYDS